MRFVAGLSIIELEPMLRAAVSLRTLPALLPPDLGAIERSVLARAAELRLAAAPSPAAPYPTNLPVVAALVALALLIGTFLILSALFGGTQQPPQSPPRPSVTAPAAATAPIPAASPTPSPEASPEMPSSPTPTKGASPIPQPTATSALALPTVTFQSAPMRTLEPPPTRVRTPEPPPTRVRTLESSPTRVRTPELSPAPDVSPTAVPPVVSPSPEDDNDHDDDDDDDSD
ncbi:MAG: hypothetical protein RMJ55_00130 [Roseiflexaceae bacterium]|nr:hypothetical protein [Roseiflexaceae bacterium]